MSSTTAATNLAILANAAEFARLTISSMMSEEKVKLLFGQPSARATVYRAVNAAINKHLSAELRALPTGQFNKSVQVGATTNRGQTNPNA